jgi:hypothetical protein
VLVISDFYEEPETIVKAIEPLRFHGSEVVLFHVLDPKEIFPEMKGPAILVDLETDQRLEVIPDYVKHQYRAKMDRHLEQMREKTQAAGMGYHLLTTDKPLDKALTEYLTLRQASGAGAVRQVLRAPLLREGACDGISCAVVSGWIAGGGAAGVCASAAAADDGAAAGEFADVL